MLFKKTKTREEPKKVKATSWTQSQALITTMIKILVWALVACGPIGTAVAVLALNAANTPQQVAPIIEEEPPGKLASMSAGEHIVTTWLGASRASVAEIEALGLPTEQLPSKGLNVSSPQAVDAVWDGVGWTVTVAVTVTTMHLSEDEGAPTKSSSQRRYFQVPLVVDAGDVTVLALPAEVAGPRVSARGNDYRVQVPSTDPLAATVQEFVAALLAGSSDITRFTAPGSGISAVAPAPYVEVIAETITARDAVTEAVGDGVGADVVVRVRADDSTGTETRLEYLLALVARDGRWEVTSIQGAPRTSTENTNP